MGIFVEVKPHRRHRVVVVAETHGPRSAKKQRAFREAIKRLFEKHASVMLPPKSNAQKRTFKKALTMLLATNLVPEKTKTKKAKRKR